MERTRVVGYIRVSTDEQAGSGLGLEAQRLAIVAEAQRRGWELAAIHEDAGASGKTMEKRPALAEALEAVQSGQAGALVVAKLDRLSRSLLDFAGLMEQSRRQGWALVALDLGVDTTTPAGEMVANVMATFAQFERRLIGERTRSALAVRKAQGMRLGRPRSLPDDVVERIRAECAGRVNDRGQPLYSAIARGLNNDEIPTAQGGAKWYPSTVRAVHLSSDDLSHAERATR